MKRWLEGIQLLVLGGWVGGMACFGVLMAPRLFAVVPSRQLAGDIAGGVIAGLSWFGVVGVSLVLVLQLVMRRRWDWRMRLLIGVLAFTLYNATYVRQQLDLVQADMSQPIEQYAVTDPLRVKYNRWHRMSSNLGVASLLLGTAVLVGWPFGRRDD